MNRQVIFCIFVLIFMSCTNIGAAQQTKRVDGRKQEESKNIYTCPMHADVKSDKPGDCPKCGMALVTERKLDSSANDENKSASSQQKKEPRKLTPTEKIKTAKRLLQEAKHELTRFGKYNCCIEEPCNQCALDHNSCPCYDDLSKGKPVCPECYGGWQRGEGRDKKVKPADVKTQFSGHKH